MLKRICRLKLYDVLNGPFKYPYDTSSILILLVRLLVTILMRFDITNEKHDAMHTNQKGRLTRMNKGFNKN